MFLWTHPVSGVLEYDHGGGCSVTGGYLYRGVAIPALQGHDLYADFCRGWVRSFRAADPAAGFAWPALQPGGNITSFPANTGHGEERLSSRRTARLLDPRVISASNLPFTPTFDPLRGGPPFSLTTVSVPVSSLTW